MRKDFFILSKNYKKKKKFSFKKKRKKNLKFLAYRAEITEQDS